MKRTLISCLIFVSGNIHLFPQADKKLEHAWNIYEVKLDSAVYLTYQAYEEAKENGDLINIGRAISYRAIFYDFEVKLDSALFLYHEAIAIQEAIHDTTGLVRTYNNFGVFYYMQHLWPKAEFYFQKSYEKAKLINDHEGAASALVNLGALESYKKNIDKELEYLKEAERLYMMDGDTLKLLPVWTNHASIFTRQKKYTEALSLILKVMKLNDELKNTYERISNRVLICNILTSTNRNSEAEVYALEGLALANQYGLVERKQYLYDILAKTSFAKGDYQTAYKYTNLYVDIRDSLLTEGIAKQQAEMEARNGIERKNTEITRLKLDVEKNKNIQLQKEKLQVRFYFILIVSGISILVLIILTILIVALRKNLRLERTNSGLLVERKQTAELLLEKEKLLMRESHHRIKNNLQLINSILDLQSRNIKDPLVKKTFTESIHRIQAISFAHQRLYGNETVEKLDLSGFLKELVHSIQSSLVDPASDISIVTDIPELTLSTEKAIPIGLIVNELLTNAIKYAFTDRSSGTIRISLQTSQNEVVLVVEDDGKGMENNPEGSGFGHQLVKSMTRQLKAKYSIYLERGVKHLFTIPLS